MIPYLMFCFSLSDAPCQYLWNHFYKIKGTAYVLKIEFTKHDILYLTIIQSNSQLGLQTLKITFQIWQQNIFVCRLSKYQKMSSCWVIRKPGKTRILSCVFKMVKTCYFLSRRFESNLTGYAIWATSKLQDDLMIH